MTNAFSVEKKISLQKSWPLSVFTLWTTQLQTFIMFGRKDLFFPAYFGTNTGI